MERHFRILNPDPRSKKKKGVRMARIVNPAPGQPWKRVSVGRGMSRVMSASGLLLGHVQAEPEGWYASVLGGEVYGPFSKADEAAQTVYEQARTMPSMEALQINLKKLKARLLR